MAIAGGELPVGAMLPSVRGLAQQFAVNPKTVAKAYDEFANEGWLNARPGLGLLVAERQQRRSDSERERRLDIALDTFSAEVIGVGYPREQVLDQVRTKLSPILGKRTPANVAMDRGAEVLPWQGPTFRKFAGDPAPLLGTYRGPSRGRDMVVEVTHTPQGLAFSVNGSPARPLPFLRGLTWQGGTALLEFRRAGEEGPASELRFDGGGGAYYILKRQ